MKRELAGMSYEQVDQWCHDRWQEIDFAIANNGLSEDMARTLRAWVTDQRAAHFIAYAMGLVGEGE